MPTPPPMTSPVPTQVRGITYMPEPTAENVPGPTNIGYHVRLRGRLNEPVFQHCAHADRIFVIEAIEPLQMYHPYASVFAPPLPNDYAQWQRYSDPDLGFSFSYPPDWQIKGAQEPGMLGSLILHAPKWPQHMIRLRITPAVALPEQAAPAFYGIGFEQAQAHQFMKLAPHGATFTGKVIVREIGPYRWFVTETFTANGRDYEFSVGRLLVRQLGAPLVRDHQLGVRRHRAHRLMDDVGCQIGGLQLLLFGRLDNDALIAKSRLF